MPSYLPTIPFAYDHSENITRCETFHYLCPFPSTFVPLPLVEHLRSYSLETLSSSEREASGRDEAGARQKDKLGMISSLLIGFLERGEV